MSYKRNDMENNPAHVKEVRNLSRYLASEAADPLIAAYGLHPASALCSIMGGCLELLRGMSDEGVRLMVRAMLKGQAGLKDQDRAMRMMMDGFEALAAQAERDEAGETIQ